MPETTPPGLGASFAERVNHFRTLRKMSMRALAEACADAGSPDLTEASLVNITRKTNRRRVTLDQWLTIAEVLGVSPVALLLPLDSAGSVELTPRTGPVPNDHALAWIDGTALLGPYTPPAASDFRAVGSIHALRTHRTAVLNVERWINQARMIAPGEAPEGVVSHEEARAQLTAALLRLRQARDEIRGRGDALPDLDPDIQRHLDEVSHG